MTPPPANRLLILTGLWVPVIGHAPSDGQKLARRLAKAYPHANVAWHSWFESIDVDALATASRVALIGHSFGGAICCDLARQLERRGRRVEELLLLDPVPTNVVAQFASRHLDVPPNVDRARCIARATRLFPRSKLARGDVRNETRRVPHDDFMRDREIVAEVEAIARRLAE